MFWVAPKAGSLSECEPSMFLHLRRGPSLSSTFACPHITIITITRPKPAYGRQGLDWIVGPGYSFVVFSTNKTMETNQKP